MAKKPVARQGDAGSHGGFIITGSSPVFVNGQPVACVGDLFACSKHGTNPIVTGAPAVHLSLDGRLVAHVGSTTACGATITTGSPSVFVGVPEAAPQEAPAEKPRKKKVAAKDKTPPKEQAPAAKEPPREPVPLVPEEDLRPQDEPEPETTEEAEAPEEEEQRERYKYVDMDNVRFDGKSVAFIWKGSGFMYDFPPISASFSVYGDVRLKGNTLHIFATGKTGLMAQPNAPIVRFHAKATVFRNGQPICTGPIVRGPHGYWLGDQTLEHFIGEVEFQLPEPTDETPLVLLVEGSYLAEFSEGTIPPIGPWAKSQLPITVVKVE